MMNQHPTAETTLPSGQMAVDNNSASPGAAKTLDKEGLQKIVMDSLAVQDLLHICRGTLYNWRRKGLIAFSKIGGRVYFEVDDVYQMLKERKQKKWKIAA